MIQEEYFDEQAEAEEDAAEREAFLRALPIFLLGVGAGIVYLAFEGLSRRLRCR